MIGAVTTASRVMIAPGEAEARVDRLVPARLGHTDPVRLGRPGPRDLGRMAPMRRGPTEPVIVARAMSATETTAAPGTRRRGTVAPQIGGPRTSGDRSRDDAWRGSPRAQEGSGSGRAGGRDDARSRDDRYGRSDRDQAGRTDGPGRSGPTSRYQGGSGDRPSGGYSAGRGDRPTQRRDDSDRTRSSDRGDGRGGRDHRPAAAPGDSRTSYGRPARDERSAPSRRDDGPRDLLGTNAQRPRGETTVRGDRLAGIAGMSRRVHPTTVEATDRTTEVVGMVTGALRTPVAGPPVVGTTRLDPPPGPVRIVIGDPMAVAMTADRISMGLATVLLTAPGPSPTARPATLGIPFPAWVPT